MKLLIVDDEQLARDDLTFVLRECLPQAEILAAGNQADALALCRSNPADIAFLDVEMPDISGLELAKKLRTVKQDINIIFTTAYSQYALPAFKLYASAYLLKPVRREEVLEALENLRFPFGTGKKMLQVQCFGCQHLVIFIVQADCTCICRHTHDTCLKYFGTGCYPYTVHLLHIFDNNAEAASFQEPGFHFA